MAWSWKNNLRVASFRGVPFHVESVSTEIGRRNVLHEYPFKDEPYLEDLGKSAGVYNVTGYVLQSLENNFDYFGMRDALMAALEEEGPGILVHPFFGELFVGLMGKARVDEHMQQGAGVARFQMVFVIAGAAVSPSGEVDYTVSVDNAVDAQLLANEESFIAKFQAFSDGLTQAVNDVNSAINMVRGTLYSVQAAVVSTISQVQTTIAGIYNTIDAIAAFPSQLVAAITATLETYVDLHDDASNNTLVNATLALTKYGEAPNSANVSKYGGALEPVPDTGTANSDQKIINRNAVIHTVRVGAILEAARITMRINYTSYNQAFAMMQKMVAEIDALLEYIGTSNDELYSALQEFKPLIVSGLLTKGASLPLIIDYEVPADVTPSLVIAYDLYEDTGREQEVIDRNPIAMIHPGFAPSGDILEVRNE